MSSTPSTLRALIEQHAVELERTRAAQDAAAEAEEQRLHEQMAAAMESVLNTEGNPLETLFPGIGWTIVTGEWNGHPNMGRCIVVVRPTDPNEPQLHLQVHYTPPPEPSHARSTVYGGGTTKWGVFVIDPGYVLQHADRHRRMLAHDLFTARPMQVDGEWSAPLVNALNDYDRLQAEAAAGDTPATE